jgi:sugar phosphate isomerase/epimerase
MNTHMKRRGFLTRGIGVAAACALSIKPETLRAVGEVNRLKGSRVKLAVNAYCFNAALLAGKMTLEDVIDFCVAHNVDGVDLTAYYFHGYPAVPSDDDIFKLKKKAYLNGVTINCTGVKNDFSMADALARQGQIQLVKDWVGVAAKLGAGAVRVFCGPGTPGGPSFDQFLEWAVPAFQECAEYGKQHGVVIALQPHHDMLQTAQNAIRIVQAVHSEWFSVLLDIGSLREDDPYLAIEKLLPYTCTWQFKEEVFVAGKSTPIDLVRIKQIIDKVGFRGFLPIEVDDPAIFIEKIRKVMS